MFSILVLAYFFDTYVALCEFGGTRGTPVTPPSPCPSLRGQISLFKSEPWKHEIEEQRPGAEAGSEGRPLFSKSTQSYEFWNGKFLFSTPSLSLSLFLFCLFAILFSVRFLLLFLKKWRIQGEEQDKDNHGLYPPREPKRRRLLQKESYSFRGYFTSSLSSIEG